MINSIRQRIRRTCWDGTENPRLESRKPFSRNVSTIAGTTKITPNSQRKSTRWKRTRYVFTWKMLRKLWSDSIAWSAHRTRKMLRTNVQVDGKIRESLWALFKLTFANAQTMRHPTMDCPLQRYDDNLENHHQCNHGSNGLIRILRRWYSI